jgi:ferredoxin
VEPADERCVHDLRIRIDRELCVGFGDCVEEAPEAFKLDESGIVVFVNPESIDRDRLVRASDVCPVDAITVWNAKGEQLAPS